MATSPPVAPRFVVDHAQMRILINATALPLTPVEFRLLDELIAILNASTHASNYSISRTKISVTSMTALSIRTSRISARKS
jgi:hypothetical protein